MPSMRSVAQRVLRISALGLLAAVVLTAGCATRRPPLTASEPGPSVTERRGEELPVPPPKPPILTAPKKAEPPKKLEAMALEAPLAKYPIVRVYFATDRARTADYLPKSPYGSGRSIMGYGFSDVSIPPVHRPGELERPSLWRFELAENPERHIVVRSFNPESRPEFFRSVAGAVGRSPEKSALVFVHGYNVEFLEAVRRTAQITYDLGFDGASILFSWPSRGRPADYTIDEASAEAAVPDLREFLTALASETGVRVIHVVAHSMGNRALLRALADVESDPRVPQVFRNVVLAAPDIDRDVFTRDLLPRFKGRPSHLTLYASDTDEALKASKKFHGYPRAGEAGRDIVVAPDLDTIDATGMDPSLLGHSYFASLEPVVDDIAKLLRGDLAPAQRGLREQVLGALKYWIVLPQPNP